MELQRSPPARARSHAQGEVDARLGRGAHLQHDRRRAPTGASRASASGACPSSCSIAPAAASRSPIARSSTASSTLFAEHTADIWYERTAAELIRPERAARSAAARNSRKENDILDVWFDSGSSHLAVLTPENGLPWPSDLYLEGGDQYRGWFHSSLLVGVGLKGRAPYRDCATQRLDARWRRPRHAQVARQRHRAGRRSSSSHGAEVLRLWSASVEFNEDVRVSDTILHAPHRGLSQAAQHVPLRARQHLRFRSADAMRCPATDLLEIDQWILLRAEELVARCLVWYDEFAFHKVYRAVYDFATVDLSSIYFDVLKDRLYTVGRAIARPPQRADRAPSPGLRAGAPARADPDLHHGRGLGRIWGRPDSVHLALFPEPGGADGGHHARRSGNGRPTGTV